MKCPHCQTEIHGNPTITDVRQDSKKGWGCMLQICPACKKDIVHVLRGDVRFGGALQASEIPNENYRVMAYPQTGNRPPAPADVVSKGIAEDYNEACQVLELSPKASAALSRRCLQHVLREKGGIKSGNLGAEIDQVLSTLPSHLAEAVDAIRNIGNFAAHPSKSSASGEIVDVEEGEAEWCLDVLEQLFDFYYVQPKKTADRRAALDTKLAKAGRNPMK